MTHIYLSYLLRQAFSNLDEFAGLDLIVVIRFRLIGVGDIIGFGERSDFEISAGRDDKGIQSCGRLRWWF